MGGAAPEPVGMTSELYAPTDLVKEHLAYARVIRLSHSGSANGTLLGSFEHWTDGSPGIGFVRRSTDDGKSWSTAATIQDPETGAGHPSDVFWQPFLYEFPRTIGGFPAGTLLLSAHLETQGGGVTNLELWRSTDHGTTWTYVGLVQRGGPSPAGIWEPFITDDGGQNLLYFFSDERQRDTHSQMLVHVVSADGGKTWSAKADGSTANPPGLVLDVSSSQQPDRPGMVTVAKMPDDSWAMTFEICGGDNGCAVHFKKSTDHGQTWGTGPGDLGVRLQTTDGRSFSSSPYIAWSPAGGAKGTLFVAACHTGYGGGTAPEEYQAVFLNSNGGDGDWNWMPGPARVGEDGSTGNCSINYSPSLLPSADGLTLRYSAASQSKSQTCAERTTDAAAGVLPYASPFAFGNAAGWLGYGGCWTVDADGVYSDTCPSGAGNKSITGSTGWADYVLHGQVKMDAQGGSGFLVRVSDPGTGADTHRGYFIGLGTDLFLGRQDRSWTQLKATPLSQSFAGVWYDVTVRAQGCAFQISAAPADKSQPATELDYTDTGCTMTSGAVGVRDMTANTSWRDITVEAL